jgi:CHAD domain-containing protein
MISNAANHEKRPPADLATVFSFHQQQLERAAAAVARNPSAAAVHRTRVAARRLRALLSALGERKNRIEVRRYRRDLRSLALELATVRQADVMRDEMLDTLAKLDHSEVPGRRKVRALLDQECVLARRQLRAHARSVAWQERLQRLQRSSSELLALLARMRDEQSMARDMIVNSAQAFWRARRRGNGNWRDLHRIRIHAKSHRYVVDALAPLVDLDARQFSVTARTIQQGIGRHLDARAARKWLSSHQEPVGASLAEDAAERLRTEGRRSLKEAKRGLRSLSA